MAENTDLWQIERDLTEQGIGIICGCDEAGAGPLAGPVYAAAVILPPYCQIEGLNDSKKLTEKKREALYEVITQKAVCWAVARVEAAEIDATDILSARMKAMQQAMDALTVQPDIALIDGNRDKGRNAAITTPHKLVVGGDGKSASIAAASILAGTGSWPVSWTSVIPSTSLPNTRATPPSCIMKCWINSAPARSTGAAS